MFSVLQPNLTPEELNELFRGISRARVGLIGDLCLDLYWHADMRLSELSRETPHHPLPVVQERCYPGGAGNVACNIAALKPAALRVVSVIGTDWRGDLLQRELKNNGVDCSTVFRSPEFTTNTYIKPLRRGISDVVYEDPRIDFENRSPISAELESQILNALTAVAEEVDVLCVSDQMKYGVITPAVRQKICELGKQGKVILVDSRDHISDYSNVILKPNEIEAARAFCPGTEDDLERLAQVALEISARNNRPAIITLGANGCFVAENSTVVRCATSTVPPPIDFCGAGDTFLSGFACAYAGGATAQQSARMANLCSSVTIRKIGVTGTATQEELKVILGK